VRSVSPMKQTDSANELEQALKNADPQIRVEHDRSGDEVVTRVHLGTVRMTLRTSYYMNVQGDPERLQHYAERVVERLRSEPQR